MASSNYWMRCERSYVLKTIVIGAKKLTFIGQGNLFFFILFNNKKHPLQMGEPHRNQFLSYLALNQKVSASTQNQALCAFPEHST